jgi:hypothetical protein
LVGTEPVSEAEAESGKDPMVEESVDSEALDTVEAPDEAVESESTGDGSEMVEGDSD